MAIDSKVDTRATVAFAKGESYNKSVDLLQSKLLTEIVLRSRPDYPSEAYSFMKSQIPKEENLNIVE